MGSRYTDKHVSHTPPHIIEDHDLLLNDNDIDILMKPVYMCSCIPKYKSTCACPGSQDAKRGSTETSSLINATTQRITSSDNRKQIEDAADEEDSLRIEHTSITIADTHATPSQSFCFQLQKRICLIAACMLVFIIVIGAVYVS